MNRYVIGLAVWLLSLALAAGLAWDYRGAVDDQAQLAAVEAAVEAANEENKRNRAAERSAQEAINDATQKQFEETLALNASLNRELDRLRRRPPRRDPTEGAGAKCSPASGADLSREDAEFLVREAARADELRTALIACYSYADSVAALQQASD